MHSTRPGIALAIATASLRAAMRHHRYAALIAAVLLALSSQMAYAQSEDDDDEASGLMQMLMSDEGLPQADLGQQDEHGWFLKREGSVCTMRSFNDSVALQVDPANPRNTVLKFQLFDSEMPEAEGTQVPLVVGVRGQPEGKYAVYNVTATVSKSPLPAYVVPAPLAELVANYPNGFELLLGDETGENKIMASDTIGSGRQLAALVACGKEG